MSACKAIANEMRRSKRSVISAVLREANNDTPTLPPPSAQFAFAPPSGCVDVPEWNRSAAKDSLERLTSLILSGHIASSTTSLSLARD